MRQALKPVMGGFAITPGTDPLPEVTKAINVAVTGNVTCTLYPTGISVTLHLVAGYLHPIAATKVTAATATGIVGLY